MPTCPSAPARPPRCSSATRQHTTTHIATTTLSPSSDTLTLSADPTGQTGVISLGPPLVHSGALGVGESYTRTAQVTLPKNVASGIYFVFVTSSGPYQF